MKYTDPEVRLVIAGAADAPGDLDSLWALAREHGVAERVHFTDWISDEENAKWMSGCCAALYLAYDEDSYGYVTLEAMHSAKPVITLTDSGGPLEVIEDENNGSVVAPDPQALGETMTRYWRDRDRARRLGEEAQRTLARFRIDWDHVVENLTS
jgi:glycosyltransferase involved in cell wall biosynthesis